ncbi:AAA family ATPase [Sphingomonas sp. PP-CC-3G-468]|uniref:AAA family ATPase n=1 Tax=Sphingomonas sp. PP-CC-3G-468 TaxID=2135656 RepID=UPI00104FF26A|nr:AAA family ATPase [Sphingomonas sp. PP-CC-3G-468]TCM04745.1 DNA repair exonuclease SbcCD ATPase subunit [Sphingomonas sp. PP-CC-3G-468]
MSLTLRRITANNFRKFRAPVTIDGLTEGLNIVVEPNETGKSTLLEAIRAAFFVPHRSSNQLTRSYQPFGENVAPEVEVGFDVAGVPWTVTKRFLKSPSMEVRGPGGRSQGDAAEEQLQALLGFEKDTSRNGDVTAYGALGLLWVGQAEALSVSAPGRIVRDTIQATLEAEVGTILGGAAYERVRERVDQQFAAFWTAKGSPGSEQKAAKERLDQAQVIAREAASKLELLEKSFLELEATRGRLKLLQREMADPTDIDKRTDLVRSLEIARAAAQMLAQRKAEFEIASIRVQALDEVASRHAAAVRARDKAQVALNAAEARRAERFKELAAGRHKADTTRTALVEARTNRQQAKAALAEAEQHAATLRRRQATRSARIRHDTVIALERRLSIAKTTAATMIAPEFISRLEKGERSIAEARAQLAAGATTLELVGYAPNVKIDGTPVGTDRRVLTNETCVDLGNGVELIIRPPASAGNAELALAEAIASHDQALTELGVESIAVARQRNDTARDAAGEMKTLSAQLDASTPADPEVGLAAGVAALKVLAAGLLPEPEGEGDNEEAPSVRAFANAVDVAETSLARAEGAQESAATALRRIEEQDRPLAATEAGAASDLQSAVSQLQQIENGQGFANLEKDIIRARERAAEAATVLNEAERNAVAHDVRSIERGIANIETRQTAANEARRQLETDIARLEGTIESEGGKGLAERAAVATEEAIAAEQALVRTTEEAQTLKLLRDTLEEVRTETSRTYVGPVTSRAKRYIERLLPSSELVFADDLGLAAISRGGPPEDCVSLSRGTQEQLAILTRLAIADLLRDEGRPVSLILDDPLVYSDDTRLDLMTELLTEAAQHMQVILLTCRERAFRHMDGTRLVL